MFERAHSIATEIVQFKTQRLRCYCDFP